MTDACWHCGEPLGDAAVQARTPDGEHDACCRGCAGAIEMIHGLGLGDYYAWRQDGKPPAPPADEGARQAELALFDIPELVAPWREDRDQVSSLTLLIEGIHCAACAWLIEKALLELPGVENASLNLSSHRLRVRWRNDSDLAPRAIAARLLALGYGPRLPSRDARLSLERREQRRLLIRLVVAGLGTMQAMMFAVALYAGAFHDMAPLYRDLFRWFSLVVATPVVFYAGWPFLAGAWRGLKQRAPGMDLPVSIALLMGWGGSLFSTLTGGMHVYYESISMFVFFLLASRWLEQRARLKVTLALSNLRDSLPLAVHRRRPDGSLEQVPAAAVFAGDVVRVSQGEVAAVDGRILEGDARVDEAVMTGEFQARRRRPGDPLVAGSRLLEGHLFVRAEAGASESLMARIGNLVDRAQERHADRRDPATALVPWFVSGIVVLAALTFLIHQDAGTVPAFEYALAVLVVACPCALALAGPLTVSAALAGALRRGLLVARPAQLLAWPRITDVLLDKTGTLTRGRFTLTRETVLAEPLPVDQMRALVAGLEAHARHPLGRALAQLASPAPVEDRVERRDGVHGRALGHDWRLGAPEDNDAGTASGESTVVLYCDEQPVMRFDLADAPRPEAVALCRHWRSLGLRLHLASGDRAEAVAPLARACGIDDWRAGLRPEDKLHWLESLKRDGRWVMMTGDGVNDAPALAAADTGVAMAGGPALARDAAGVYLLEDDLAGLEQGRVLAFRVRRVLRQNLGWALLYNISAVPFAMAGLVPPWLAALGMSLSSLLVTANASRLHRVRQQTPEAAWKLSSC